MKLHKRHIIFSVILFFIMFSPFEIIRKIPIVLFKDSKMSFILILFFVLKFVLLPLLLLLLNSFELEMFRYLFVNLSMKNVKKSEGYKNQKTKYKKPEIEYKTKKPQKNANRKKILIYIRIFSV